MPARPIPIEDRLRQALGDELLTQEPLRHHTTFRIGGPADYYFAARTRRPAGRGAAHRAIELELPVFLLGGGSNLLVSDEGFRGLVVRNAIEERRVRRHGRARRLRRRLPRVDLALPRPRARRAGVRGGHPRLGRRRALRQRRLLRAGHRLVHHRVHGLHARRRARCETRPASWFEFAYRDSRLKREPAGAALLPAPVRPGERGGDPGGDRREARDPAREAPAVADRAHRRLVLQEPAAGLPGAGAAALAGHAPRRRRARCSTPAGAAGCASATRWCSPSTRTSSSTPAAPRRRDVLDAGRDHEVARAREVRRRAGGGGHVPRREAELDLAAR